MQTPHGVKRCGGWVVMAVLAWSLGACSPALDWRELPLADSARVLMPCKPERIERQLPLLGVDVAAVRLVCEADGLTWSATSYHLAPGMTAEAAQAALREHLVANLGSRAALPLPASTTPAAGVTERWRVLGQRPGGAPVRAEALLARQDGAAGAWLVLLVVLAPGDPVAVPARDSRLDDFFMGLSVAHATGAAGWRAPG